jgi:hypothetical protein
LMFGPPTPTIGGWEQERIGSKGVHRDRGAGGVALAGGEASEKGGKGAWMLSWIYDSTSTGNWPGDQKAPTDWA